jgi:hypothetical protein
VPILTVFEGSKTAGEVIRVRDPGSTITRTEGYLRFPMDGRISSRRL